MNTSTSYVINVHGKFKARYLLDSFRELELLLFNFLSIDLSSDMTSAECDFILKHLKKLQTRENWRYKEIDSVDSIVRQISFVILENISMDIEEFTSISLPGRLEKKKVAFLGISN